MPNRVLTRSLIGGFVSVAAFSLTAPATKVAVSSFSPLAVTGMRGLIAGIFCLGYLLMRRGPIPPSRTLFSLFTVALIGSCGFSGFLALGLQTVPAAHASVFLAMLPLMTAIFSKLYFVEKTSGLFWFSAVLGGLISAVFLASRSHGSLAVGDAYLLLAVLSAAWGYVVAAKHTKVLGGASTMSWIVVTGSPLYALLLVLGEPDFSRVVSADSIVALLYLGMISQSLGMFLWCWSLSTGHATLVSQTQIIQPLLSLVAAAFLLGESVGPDLIWITLALIGCVALATYAQVRQKRPSRGAARLA